MSNVTLKHTCSLKSGTTDYTVQQFYVCISSRAPHCHTVQQNGQDKPWKEQPIMENSLGHFQDARSLRRCSENWLKMLLKSHLGIKYHSVNTVLPIVNEWMNNNNIIFFIETRLQDTIEGRKGLVFWSTFPGNCLFSCKKWEENPLYH